MWPLKRQLVPTPDPEAFVLWRSRQLREAGFDPQLAATVAEDYAYDLHAILRLVDDGCPPALAARILSPIE
jgi:predicted transglutaminase-like cysteine proteinase